MKKSALRVYILKILKDSFIFLIISFLLFTANPLQADTGSTAARCPYHSYKVAVFQAGSYTDYQKVFIQTVIALQNKGLLSGAPFTSTFIHDQDNNFQRLAKDTAGGCIEFLSDGLYNGSWDSDLISVLADDLKTRVIEHGDVDMIWALGTVAGRLFADGSLDIPVLVMTPTDPESSGIIGPGNFSGRPNVHVQKEVNRYNSELRLFYNIFKFGNLGIIIDSDDDNLPGQAVPVIRELASELNFKVTECRGEVIGSDVKRTQAEFSRCVRQLADNTDVEAVYIPMGNGASSSDFYSQIKPLIERKIPTFSQSGEAEVMMGALMALSNADLQASGEFEADVIEAVVKGRKPEELSQYYYAPLMLCLNLETARALDFKPDFSLLRVVDLVYEGTQKGASN